MNGASGGFDDEADEDLLTMMSWEDEPGACRSACAAFYRRHSEYIYARCCHAYLGNGMNHQDVEDLVSDTFQRARKHAATFRPSDEGDVDYRRHRVRAWLNAIAYRLALDVFRGRKQAPKLLLDPGQLESPRPAPAPSERTLLMQRALAEVLDSREREILLVTMQYYKPDKAHQRLPDEIAADLAKRFETTSDNIRKIRMRAFTKIREYIQTSLPGSMRVG